MSLILLLPKNNNCKSVKLREVITQVSHSKKWPKLKQLDENGEVKRNAKGKTILVNSYSLLQDRYHDHMKQAGFVGFERGERGSTAEHLSVLEFKTKKEAERAAAMTAVAEKVVADIEEIEKMGHKRTLFGGVTLPADFWNKVLNLVKEALKSRDIISALRKKVNESAPRIAELERQLQTELKAKEAQKMGISDTMKYHQAMQRAPRRLADTVANIMRQPPEQIQARQQTRTITKNNDIHR